MNILVTGAAGFFGKNLVCALKNLRDGKDRTRPDLVIGTIWEYDIDTEKAERIYIGLVQNPVVSIDEDVILLANTTYLNEGGKVYSSSRLTRDSSGRWQA